MMVTSLHFIFNVNLNSNKEWLDVTKLLTGSSDGTLLYCSVSSIRETQLLQ